MTSLADGLPPEMAQYVHPEWRANEAEYWAQRERLLESHRGQWVAFAGGTIIASGKNSLAIFEAGQLSGRHAFVTYVGGEEVPDRIRRAVFPFDSTGPGTALPILRAEFRSSRGSVGIELDQVIPDTGADVTAIPWSDCRAIGFDLNLAVPRTLLGVGNSSVRTMAFVAVVVLDGMEYSCRVLADAFGQERILGRDVLNQLDILFRGPAGEVVINP